MYEDILKQIVDDLVSSLLEQKDLIGLIQQALKTDALESAMVLLRPIVQQKRELEWIEKRSIFQSSYLKRHIEVIDAKMLRLGEEKRKAAEQFFSLEKEEKDIDELLKAPSQRVAYSHRS